MVYHRHLEVDEELPLERSSSFDHDRDIFTAATVGAGQPQPVSSHGEQANLPSQPRPVPLPYRRPETSKAVFTQVFSATHLELPPVF